MWDNHSKQYLDPSRPLAVYGIPILDISIHICSRGPFIVGGCCNDLKDDVAMISCILIALAND